MLVLGMEKKKRTDFFKKSLKIQNNVVILNNTNQKLKVSID